MPPIQFPYAAPLPSYLGRVIRETRKKKGMTQADLADFTDTSAKFISQIERGKETAQIDKVLDLLRALSLHIYISDKPLNPENGHGTPFSLLE